MTGHAIQARALMTGGAALRQEIFGTDAAGASVTIEYNRGEFSGLGYYSPVKNKQQTEDAGFLDMHDCVVRVLKAYWPVPEIGKQLAFTADGQEIVLRIDELARHVAGVEWVLGCNAVI